MDFEIISEIVRVETIAKGRGIRELPRLRKHYGKGKWRKRKGIADIRLRTGETVCALSYIGTRRPEWGAASLR